MAVKGPIKPTQSGLKLGVKTTESKAPTLTPKWGAAKKPVADPARKSIWPRPPVSHANLGLSSERTRKRMVERLMQQGIRDERVLLAIERTPRHRFVDEALASRAYEDSALPIGHGQTISQPYVVARVIELALAHLGPVDHPIRALEVGAGCGYQAAVMSACMAQVVSIERIKALYELARSNLQPLKRSNLKLVFGDGLVAGLEFSPYDIILLSAGMNSVPSELLSQLRVGGVLVAPLGEPEQRLTVIQRVSESETQTKVFDVVRYVPILRGTD
jgi:protein-L-isoaspartate(D-aspartate) O-methyltransferase